MVAPLFQDRVYVADFAGSEFGSAEFARAAVAQAGFDLVVGNAHDIASTLTLTDYDPDDSAEASAPQQVSVELTKVLSDELDGAAAHLGVLNGKILLAALGRAVARVIGSGVLAVDVDSHIIALDCVLPAELDATELLAHVCSALAASTVRHEGQALADLAFRCAGPVCAKEPLEGHALELRAHRVDGLVQLDFWFDPSRFEAYTIDELAEQLPLALIEVASEALPGFVDVA